MDDKSETSMLCRNWKRIFEFCRLQMVGVKWLPHSVPQENTEIVHFPRMIKFANFEFIFAIRGPTRARRGEEINFSSTK